MKRHWRNLLISLKILSLVLLLSCNKKEDILKKKISKNLPDQQMDSVQIITSTNSIKEQKIKAVHIDNYTDEKKTYADTVFITNYNPDGSIKSTLYCDKAIIDEAKNLFTGKGNVVIESKNGILETPLLVWDRNTNEVVAKEKVTLKREKNILHGVKLITNTNLENVTIYKVSAEEKINKKKMDW